MLDALPPTKSIIHLLPFVYFYFGKANGFSDERIEFGNLRSSDIIKVGVFIIGGLMIVRNVPGLLSQVYWSIRGNSTGQGFTESDKLNLGITALNVLIGYLLVTNCDNVAKRLNRSEDQTISND